MAAHVRAGKRERAEAYAFEAAEAARRGDHRLAAALYQAAFLLLESKDEIAESNLPAEAIPQGEASEAEWLIALLGEQARRGGRTPTDGGSSEG